MGVERAVTLWYVHRQLLLDTVEQLALQLEQAEQLQDTGAARHDTAADKKVAELTLKLTQARAAIEALGPCPRPMMG